MATFTFIYSYSLGGGCGQHLLLQMSRTTLHIGDCLSALLRACRLGSPSCGPPGHASPGCQITRVAWDLFKSPHALTLRAEWTFCRAFISHSFSPSS